MGCIEPLLLTTFTDIKGFRVLYKLERGYFIVYICDSKCRFFTRKYKLAFVNFGKEVVGFYNKKGLGETCNKEDLQCRIYDIKEYCKLWGIKFKVIKENK